MPTCIEPDCGRTKLLAKDRCGRCYQRYKKRIAPLITLTCIACRVVFTTRNANHKSYCSARCRMRSDERQAKILTASLLAGRCDKPECVWCKTVFRRTATQKKRGRVFCSWDCYLKDKAKSYAAIKAVQVCSRDGCGRGDVVARGLCHRCYQQWNVRFGKSAAWAEQQCPTCQHIFPTHTNRKYCSLQCYVSSTSFKDTRQAYRDEMAQAHIQRHCLNCEKSFMARPNQNKPQQYADGKRRAAKRFCCRACYRQWFAGRFDRFVASYTALQMPCSYDEFLSQTELPCLVKGCDWVGRNLSQHCNAIHAIKADDLKALAGFNRNTGVVGAITQEKMSKHSKQSKLGNPDMSELADPEAIRQRRPPIRPEGREHIRKSANLKVLGNEVVV